MAEKYKGKLIIGLTEELTVIGKNNKRERVTARIDTGATKSSIDSGLAKELQLGPVTKTRMIRSAHGNALRPIVDVDLRMNGKKINAEFTIADRAHMKYKMLIGQNILKHGFLIDPQKNGAVL